MRGEALAHAVGSKTKLSNALVNILVHKLLRISCLLSKIYHTVRCPNGSEDAYTPTTGDTALQSYDPDMEPLKSYPQSACRTGPGKVLLIKFQNVHDFISSSSSSLMVNF